MLKLLVFTFLLICFGFLVASFLPLSKEKFLRIRDVKIKLNGQIVEIEPIVNAINQKTAMHGDIYIHYEAEALLRSGCQLQASVYSNRNITKSLISSCTSDNQDCNSIPYEGDKSIRMFLDAGEHPISPIDLVLSLEDKSNKNNMNCEKTSKNITLVPEWYRINSWQKAFAR